MTNQETLELALNALKCLFGLPDKFTGKGGDVAVWRLGGSYRAQEAIKALEEALDKQDPDYKALWKQMCERCDELDAKLSKQEQGEPVAYMRMPKVGDRVVCIEDEDLGTVQSLTAGGSPDIKFDDGSYGTYLLREFAELFRYVDTTPQQPVIDKSAAIRIATALGWTPSKREQGEPVAWIEHEWAGTGLRKLHFERHEPTVRDEVVNPIWTPLYTTPQQRTWVGLTFDEIDEGLLRSDYALQTAHAWRAGVVFAMTKLKEKNSA